MKLEPIYILDLIRNCSGDLPKRPGDLNNREPVDEAALLATSRGEAEQAVAHWALVIGTR